jgi:hypothetical protein
MRKLATVVVVAVALAGAGWFVLREADAPAVSRPSVAAVSKPAAQGARTEGTVARSTAENRSRLAATPVVPKKTLFNEFVTSREYRGLYERLRDSPEGRTPHGRLVLYEILRECSGVTGDVPRQFNRGGWSARSRDEFVASIPVTDPAREKRIAAYQQFTADRCVGIDASRLSQDDLLQMLRESAGAGEPAAQALLIEHELWAARRGSGNNTASPSDAQLEALRQAVGSRDPEAIRVAGRVLANGWSDYALRIGPEQLPVEPRPFVNSWLVLACEYGAPCGADTPRMLQACAMQGYCDAQSFPEYLATYGTTIHDATMLMQYRGLVRSAIESGDWSQIQVLRGQPQGNSRPTFIPGPR